jgi:hypothetical protein
MTLTPQDRETIERARSISGLYQGTPVSILCDLLSILDRLAAEENAAPSSPLPDALCARCGKRYDKHDIHCYSNKNTGLLFMRSDAPDKPENIPFSLASRHRGQRSEAHGGD